MSKILGPPKRFAGKVTISRPVGREKKSEEFRELILLTIDNAETPHKAMEVQLTLEDFSRALTGVGRVPGVVWAYPDEEEGETKCV